MFTANSVAKGSESLVVSAEFLQLFAGYSANLDASVCTGPETYRSHPSARYSEAKAWQALLHD